MTIAGRQVPLGEYGSSESRDEYDRVIAEWLAAGRPRVASAGQLGLSVNELILAYLRHAAEYYRKPSGEQTSEYDQMRNAVRELKRLYGYTPADEFRTRELKAIRESLVASGLTREGVNRRVSRIVRVFEWGVGEGLIDPMTHYAISKVSPLYSGRTRAPETEPVKPVSDEHIDAIAGHVSRQVWAMVQLQRHTGMRPGEVCRMRTGEIEQSADVWLYVPKEHKTAHRGHHRVVPIGPKGQAVLSEWLLDDPDRYLFSPAEAEKERRKAQRAARKTKVQPSQRKARRRRGKRRPSDHYTVQSYGKSVRRACEKAKIPAWSPNQIRHTVATEIEKDFDLMAASNILGHRSLKVTQVYAERNLEQAIQVARERG